MAQQSRRRASSNLTRRQRRATGARTYTTPTSQPYTPRRSYLAEPAPIDQATEYRFIRKDLIRILVWATILIGAMAALWVLQIL